MLGDVRKLLSMKKKLRATFYAMKTPVEGAWELVFQLKTTPRHSTTVRLIIDDMDMLFRTSKLGIDTDAGIDSNRFDPVSLARLRLCRLILNALSYVRKNVELDSIPGEKELVCKVGSTLLDYELTMRKINFSAFLRP